MFSLNKKKKHLKKKKKKKKKKSYSDMVFSNSLDIVVRTVTGLKIFLSMG